MSKQGNGHIRQGKLSVLVYSSRATVKLDQGELDLLLGNSREHNAETNLTGILMLVHAGLEMPSYYLQLLEGNRKDVDETYDRISRDDLHEEIRLLRNETVGQRMFSDWSMAMRHLGPEKFAALSGRAANRQSAQIAELVRDAECVQRVLAYFAQAQ